jgi:hypothetical protein
VFFRFRGAATVRRASKRAGEFEARITAAVKYGVYLRMRQLSLHAALNVQQFSVQMFSFHRLPDESCRGNLLRKGDDEKNLRILR